MTTDRTDAAASDGPVVAGHELFDDLVEELLVTEPATSRATMMGYRCVRVGGTFAASLDHNGDLVVKLPVDRVAELRAEGRVGDFAPNGHALRQWVRIPGRDERRWRTLLTEAVEHARPDP